jgi:UDP-N-acetylglucosamine 4,6-dehydratase/5-epimerase
LSAIKGVRLLVTGGTGSFGSRFIKRLLADNEVAEVIVFSRDELKQFELHNELKSSKVRFVLGDVRDFARIHQASQGVDIIIHAAAMKQIPAAENNPMEAIKTNVLGAENVVRAAIENNVAKVVALSSDKAANPANLYGATKLCSDKLMIAGNFMQEKSITKFSVVRYGNVLGSRGSVIPFFLEKAKEGRIPITDTRMTRFWLTLDHAVDLVMTAIRTMSGGEIYVPKIPSFKVIDVAKVVAPNIPTFEIGIRPGEKLHEIMITEDDSQYTIRFDDHFRIVSPFKFAEYSENRHVVNPGFSYRSDTNDQWFTNESFLKLLKQSSLL